MFNTKKISDIVIKPIIKTGKYNKNNVRAFDYYNEVYANTALMARKKSGKTNLLYNVLQECAGSGTNIYIFCPTINMDPTYEKMLTMLKKKKCVIATYEHFIDENGVDLIKQLLSIFNDKYNDKDEEEQDELTTNNHPPPLMYFGNDKYYKHEGMLVGGGCRLTEKPPPKKETKKEQQKGKGSKLLTPENIIIMDDLSSDLRHKSITQLLTKNRHYKLKTFFSCHSINNLEPAAIVNIDNFHLFGNIPNDKIDELREKANITFKNDDKYNNKLQQLYDYATEEPYSFLYINRNDGTYRKNFNELIDIDE